MYFNSEIWENVATLSLIPFLIWRTEFDVRGEIDILGADG